MLIPKRPATLATTTTINDKLGVTLLTFAVVFRNMKSSEFDAMTAKEETTVAKMVLAVVDSWELDYPLDADGLQQIEDELPGFCVAVLKAFHASRQVELAKN